MKYFRGYWIHDRDTDPIAYYLEIDADRDTTRMIEVMADGELRFHSKYSPSPGALIETRPLPSENEINKHRELAIVEIGKELFDRIWTKLTP